MFCDCGEKISEKDYRLSIEYRKDTILCGQCFGIWSEGKNIRKNGRPMKRLRTHIVENANSLSVANLAKELGCHRNTIYRRLKHDETFKRAYREANLIKWAQREKIIKLSKLFFKCIEKLSDSEMRQIYKILKNKTN